MAKLSPRHHEGSPWDDKSVWEAYLDDRGIGELRRPEPEPVWPDPPSVPVSPDVSTPSIMDERVRPEPAAVERVPEPRFDTARPESRGFDPVRPLMVARREPESFGALEVNAASPVATSPEPTQTRPADSWPDPPAIDTRAFERPEPFVYDSAGLDAPSPSVPDSGPQMAVQRPEQDRRPVAPLEPPARLEASLAASEPFVASVSPSRVPLGGSTRLPTPPAATLPATESSSNGSALTLDQLKAELEAAVSRIEASVKEVGDTLALLPQVIVDRLEL